MKIPRIILTQNYSIEEARTKDIDFIYERIVSEAKSGHFHPDFATEEPKKGLMHQLFCSIHLKKMPDIDGSICDSLIFTVRKDRKPIGFMWFKTFLHQSESGWELQLVSIHPDHRGKNIGRESIKNVVNILNHQANVFSRVYRNIPNIPMVKILKSEGFVEQRNTNQYSTIRLFKKSS